jgi:hypothetical protein
VCWGEKQLPVQFLGRRFTWTFLLAKVEFPILGADFLKHFNLIVDLAASQLLATDTLQRFAAGPPAATAAAAQSRGGLFSAVESTPPLFRGVFNEFQDVASSSSSLPPVKHKTLHHINTTGPPATARFRRGKVGGRQGRVQQVREGWYHPAVFQQLVGPAAHGDEARWFMAALRRLSSPEPGYHT